MLVKPSIVFSLLPVTATSPRERAIAYVLKLAALTLVLSVAVKYGGEYLHLPARPAVAIAMLPVPAIVVAIRLAILQAREKDED